MTNEVGADARIDGRFRPESIKHFKDVSKNLAWLLDRPAQKCQEDLARVYGYSGLHELQQVLSRPGIPGPFAPRYNYLSSDDEALVEEQDRRIFFFFFGVHAGSSREKHLAEDRYFLVFEMGLFQEAAEHRACFAKIRQLLDYEVEADTWPLIHGWPLGLRSWLASSYTEPIDLAERWHKVLPGSRFFPDHCADIRWQRRLTGVVRLPTMFNALAPRVGELKPNGISKVPFEEFEDEAGGITDSAWEKYYLVEWLAQSSLVGDGTLSPYQVELLHAFVDRPSLATAANCQFVKDLDDPVRFRDQWAFESLKAALSRYSPRAKALFSSAQDVESIYSLLLHMNDESAEVSEAYGCQLWQFHCTSSEVKKTVKSRQRPTLQPIIHGNGSLYVPYDRDGFTMTREAWLLSHDASEFASESAAIAFERIYLPAIGIRKLDFARLGDSPFSIIEIDELLVAPDVTIVELHAYFDRLLTQFDDDYLPDSYGFWSRTLSLSYEDDDANDERTRDGDYADHVGAPAVLLINVEGCGLDFVHATHHNGKPISAVKRKVGQRMSTGGERLASMLMQAVEGLPIDVVVYDAGL